MLTYSQAEVCLRPNPSVAGVDFGKEVQMFAMWADCSSGASRAVGGSIPGIDGQHADVSFGKTLHLLLITVYYSPPMIALCKIEK